MATAELRVESLRPASAPDLAVPFTLRGQAKTSRFMADPPGGSVTYVTNNTYEAPTMCSALSLWKLNHSLLIGSSVGPRLPWACSIHVGVRPGVPGAHH